MWKAVIPGSGMQDQHDSRSFTRCAPGDLPVVEKVSEPLRSREGTSLMQTKNCLSTDKEVLGNCFPTATVIQLTFFFQMPTYPFLSLKRGWLEMNY